MAFAVLPSQGFVLVDEQNELLVAGGVDVASGLGRLCTRRAARANHAGLQSRPATRRLPRDRMLRHGCDSGQRASAVSVNSLNLPSKGNLSLGMY